MAAPGFSAQASLYNSIHHYATVVSLSGGSLGKALPALPIRNGGGNGGCSVDCTPCDATCHRTCTNSCTGRSVTSACCGPGYSCQNGKCVCLAPKMDCGGVCKACPPGSTSCQGGTCYPTPEVCSPCNYEVSTQQCCRLVSPNVESCHDNPCCGPGCTPTGPFL